MGNTNARRELQTTLAVLLLILTGLCAVGRSTRFWPIVTWPMYSTRTTAFPASHASDVELRVITADSRLLRVAPRVLFPMGHEKFLKRIIENAYTRDEGSDRAVTREWLAAVLQDYLSEGDVQMVEAWEVVWDVEPLAVPPVRRDQPADVPPSSVALRFRVRW